MSKWYEITPASTDDAFQRTVTANMFKPNQSPDPFRPENTANLTNPGDYYNNASTLGRGYAWHWNQNPDLQNAASQFNQLGGKLAQGPQNAFSQQQLAKMHALGNEQLTLDRQQTNQGIAGSNAARGVAGNNIGALLNNQTAALNRGALAKGDLEAQLAGLEQGRENYQSMVGAGSVLGTVAMDQDQQAFDTQKLDFAKREENRKRLYDEMTAAQRERDAFMRQYAVQMSRPASDDGKFDNLTTGLRNYYNELIQEANMGKRFYNEFAL